MKGKLKKLFVNHGEKIGMAVVGLIVLAGLAGADWVPYEGTPNQITTRVREAEAKWVPATWPEEEAKQFEIKPEDEPKAIVARNVEEALPLSEFMLTQKFARSPYEHVQPLTNPDFIAPQDPIASAGRVLLAVIDEEAQKEMELRMQGLGPDGKPLPAGRFPGQNPMDETIPDEFRTRPGQGVGVPGLEGLVPPTAGAEAGGYVPPGTEMPAGRSRRGRGRGVDPALATGLPEGIAPEGVFGMEGMMGAGAGLPAGQTGRGFHYVAVRAVFPIREQIHKIAEATNLQPQQAGAALEILDYRIERQTKQDSGDPWGGAWEPVDINVSTDVLTKMSVGLEPDIIYSQLTDPAMTMPLPMRISGMWRKDVTHPRIEEFTLTDEQIQQEVLFQQEALRKLQELKKELPPPPAEKKGWSQLVVSGNQLTSAMMGGDPYASGYGGFAGGFAMPEASGGYGEAGGYPGGGMGQAFGVGAGAGRPPAKIAPIDDLLKMKDKELANELKEYISKAVNVVGELLLFRYIDFSVEPGKTYRYRVRLVFRNPNFNRNVDEAGGDTSVVSGETRMSEWSEPTAPALVQKDQQSFVTDVRTTVGGAFPTPQLNVFQWDPKLGSMQQAVLNVDLGQTISGKKRTDVLDPARGTFELKEYAFQSTDFVVDALPDVQIEAAAHPDVRPAGGTRGDLMLPEQVLIALSEGGVSILDPSTSKAEEQQWKKNLEYQNKSAKERRDQASSLSDPLMMSAEGEAMGEMYDAAMTYGMRGANPLSNRRNRSRRTAAPVMP